MSFRPRRGVFRPFVLVALLAGIAGLLAASLPLDPGQSAAGTISAAAGSPQRSGDAIVTATDKTVTAPADTVVVIGELGAGGTLASALERLGVEPARAADACVALDGLVDPRRLLPETGVARTTAGDGSLRSLAVRDRPDRFVRLTWGEPGSEPGVEAIPLPVRTRVRTAGGRVATSVHQALAESDYPHHLAIAFSDVFQWDIDLLVDPRPGDELRIVYEELVLEHAPEDLPPFGDAPRRSGEILGPGRILAATYEGRMASSVAYWVDEQEGVGAYYDPDGRPMRKSFLRSPLNYRRISSGFSLARRHPVTRKVVPHHGVDFAAKAGTPVVASADGRVVSAGWEGALGRAVRVRHNGALVTVYGHLRGFAKGIRPGVQVEQNQVIGYVGSSGRATGPHLHYTLLRDGRPIDPMRFRSPPAEPLAAALRPRLELAKQRWAPMLDARSVADLSEGARDPVPGA